MKHLSVTIETTKEAADIISLLLMEEGSEGTVIEDESDLDFVKQNVYWDYADNNIIATDGRVYVTGIFDENKDISFIKSRIDQFKNVSEIRAGSLSFTVKLIYSEDYENEWKKYYNIMEFERLAIVPQWLEFSGSKPALYLNPGKAFGTGAHESTSMCLELMQSLNFENKTVLDVGCGSGILGLSALKMGATDAVLTDIDLQATEAAAENALINNLENKANIIQQSFASGITADIILANLTADLLITLKSQISRLIKKGGDIIISGIISERAKEVEAAFKDFTLEKKAARGDWRAYLYKA